MKTNKVTEAAKKKALDIAKKAKSNPKQTAYIIGGSLLLLGGIYAIGKLKKSVSDSLTAEDNQDTIEGTGGSTQNASISNQLAVNYAQQLLDAMNGAAPFYGTDEAVIEAVFDKLKTSGDFIKVYKAFGNRNYNGYNSPPESWIGQAVDIYQPRNLVYWLKSEVSPFFDAALFNKIKTTVEASGFTF